MIKKFCPKVLKCTVIQKKCIFCDKQALFFRDIFGSDSQLSKKNSSRFSGNCFIFNANCCKVR